MKTFKNFKSLIYIGTATVMLIVGGPWIYTSFIREEPLIPFTEERNYQDYTALNKDPVEIAGTWKLVAESQVGYRINERIALKTFETIGRSSVVVGSLIIENRQISVATFEVDMKTFQSDSGGRDAQFNKRIMDTEKYPIANFVLTKPISLIDAPKNSVQIKKTATGNLTLRGVTKEVTFFVDSVLDNSIISVTGQILIKFSEWGIPNPSVPLVFIYTEPNCILEFTLKFEKYKD